ncbi:MAG: hypothetical protein HY909_29145 [Deltaproteobacteria bacterium]|nr:hypothetical protein [Deltaproteobacteria bacterium]
MTGGPAFRAPRAAAVAVGCYVVHGAWHCAHGRPEDLLWMCNVSALLVGVGLARGAPGPLSIGLSWLATGTPLWLADLLGGGELVPTTLLTHGVAFGLGLWGASRLPWPAGSAWRSLAAMAALQQLCRWVTPPRANINIAHRIHPGMDRYFHSYTGYWLACTVAFATAFGAVEALGRWRTSRRSLAGAGARVKA